VVKKRTSYGAREVLAVRASRGRVGAHQVEGQSLEGRPGEPDDGPATGLRVIAPRALDAKDVDEPAVHLRQPIAESDDYQEHHDQKADRPGATIHGEEDLRITLR